VKIKIIYFAAVRDLVGLDEEELVFTEEPKIGVLVETLQKRHERLVMEGVRVALNEEFCEMDASFSEGAVVALIPPVAGG